MKSLPKLQIIEGEERKTWLRSLKVRDVVGFVDRNALRFDREAQIVEIKEQAILIDTKVRDEWVCRETGYRLDFSNEIASWIQPFNIYLDDTGVDLQGAIVDPPLPIPESLNINIERALLLVKLNQRAFREMIGEAIGIDAFSPGDVVQVNDSYCKGLGVILTLDAKKRDARIKYIEYSLHPAIDEETFNPIGNWHYAPLLTYPSDESLWSPRQNAIYSMLLERLRKI